MDIELKHSFDASIKKKKTIFVANGFSENLVIDYDTFVLIVVYTSKFRRIFSLASCYE
jgi:hypothetical protein